MWLTCQGSQLCKSSGFVHFRLQSQAHTWNKEPETAGWIYFGAIKSLFHNNRKRNHFKNCQKCLRQELLYHYDCVFRDLTRHTGSGTVVQHIKLLLGASASFMGTSLSPVSTSNPAPWWCAWESRGEWLKYLGPCSHVGNEEKAPGFSLDQLQPLWPFEEINQTSLHLSISPL